jgi:hypothetical protein
VTDPFSVPDWQTWTAPPRDSWPARLAQQRAASIRREAVVGAVVTVFSVLLGGAVGAIWPRVAPHVQVIRAIDGSEAAAKALLGDDMWFALLGIAAGVVAVALLLLVARDAGRGPGGVLGLAVGGLLGSLVAAHIGHHVLQPHIVATLHQRAPHLTHTQVQAVLGYFTFKVRANAVLTAWPMAAVILHAAAVIVRQLRLGPEA